jgi:hypothetical protein
MFRKISEAKPARFWKPGRFLEIIFLNIYSRFLKRKGFMSDLILKLWFFGLFKKIGFISELV